MSSCTLLLCLCFVSIAFGIQLFHPQAIKVSDGATLQMKSIYIADEIYNGSNQSLIASMTGRAYCINDICSIPGPTLIVYPGSTIHISFQNEFVNGQMNGPDVTNIHTHGLHISGKEDNVFEAVYPSQTQSTTFTWTIHASHHLGTNWYHAHHHGATELQVMQGMYGALIVDSPGNQQLNYNQPGEINDYVIHISWHYLYDNQHCNNCDGIDIKDFKYRNNGKSVHSLCSTWCYFDATTQRSSSGYTYDVSLNGNENYVPYDAEPAFEAFLVNNVYQPTVSELKTNEWFKLRIISSSSGLYSQLHFDYNTDTHCKYSLIARDGIALQDDKRDLSEEPYFGAFVLPPGGRIDVLVLCENTGIANIRHIASHPIYTNIENVYSFGRMDNQILFKLSIDEEMVANDPDTVPQHLRYPEPQNGFPYYLQQLIDATPDIVQRECVCSRYDRDNAEDPIIRNTDQCALELIEGGGDKYEINGVVFNSVPLFIISLDQIYGFYVNTDGHPFHIHVNPFMVEQDLLNGYIAKAGDLMDTVGYNSIDDTDKNNDDGANDAFWIRYNPRDYRTNAVLHCHFLAHEDKGMMGMIKIVRDQTDNSTYCDNTYYDKKGSKGSSISIPPSSYTPSSYTPSSSWSYKAAIYLTIMLMINLFILYLCYKRGNKRSTKYSKIVPIDL